MKKENTILDKDMTYNRDSSISSPAMCSDKDSADQGNEKKNMSWGKVIGGAVAGVLLESINSFVTAKVIATESPSETADDTAVGSYASASDSLSDATAISVLTDSEVVMASSVSEGMTFSKAFATAREEVGAGGAFEWHGNVYSTYTVDEWDNMTPEEKNEYRRHFNWGGQDFDDDTLAATSESCIEVDEDIEFAEVEDQDSDIAEECGELNPEIVAANSEVKVLCVVNDDTGVDIAGEVDDEQEHIMIGQFENSYDDNLYTEDSDYVNDALNDSV